MARKYDERSKMQKSYFPSDNNSGYHSGYRSGRRQRNGKQIWLFLTTLFGTLFSKFFTSIYSGLPNSSILSLRGKPAILPEAVDGAILTTLFWRDYRHLLTAVEDYDDWFEDVDAATRTIDAVWADIQEPAWGDKTYEAYERYQQLIKARAKHLEFARLRWQRFAENRELVILETLGAGARWRRHAETHIAGNAGGGTMDQAWGFASLNGTASYYIEEGQESLVELRLSAWRITEELAKAHANLFKDLDAAYTHMRQAEFADEGLKDLLNELDKGIWIPQLAVSIGELKRRIQRLQGKKAAMEREVKRLQTLYPEAFESTPEELEDQVALAKDAKALRQEWVAALLDVLEGVLYLLRRREVPREQRLISQYTATWEEWKKRNCGDTSCYDPSGAMANVRSLAGRKKPLAGIAQDESKWIASLGGDGTPRIWRVVYDKACCQASVLRDRLQHGVGQPLEANRRK